jgi:hypothetical protein
VQNPDTDDKPEDAQ